MSVGIFIAANVYLEEIKNPHHIKLSINEAINIGLDVGEEILSTDIDKDLPDTILWIDTELIMDNGRLIDGDFEDDFALLIESNTLYYCDKIFGVYIQWNHFTKERANKIIEYIKNILLKTDCVEIWNVWLSDCDPPHIETTIINIKQLQPIHIKQITESHPWDNESIINTLGCNTPIHRCLRITI